MTHFNSFDAPLTVAVFGASGGIGSAMIERLLRDDRVEEVLAFSRSAPSMSAPEDKTLSCYPVDVADELSIATAAQSLQGKRLDLVIVATGLLHQPEISPEKSLNGLSEDSFQQLMSVNALAPLMIAKHLQPLMQPRQKTVFAALSARVGSISDNRLGGWYSYRASKAALNMLLKTLAIETRRRNPQQIIVGLHPGTVDTALSKPFQKNVKPGALFTADDSARYLLNVIDGLSAEQSGGIFDWKGREITP